MNDKIFISGKMTGVKDFNFPAFFETESKLLHEGYSVVNPARISVELAHKQNKTLEQLDYIEILKKDMQQLLECDCIYMLPGWQGSRGANLELYVATQLKIKVIYGK